MLGERTVDLVKQMFVHHGKVPVGVWVTYFSIAVSYIKFDCLFATVALLYSRT